MEKKLTIVVIVFLIIFIVIMSNLLLFLLFSSSINYVEGESNGLVRKDSISIETINKIIVEHVNASIEICETDSNEVEVMQYAKGKIDKNLVYKIEKENNTLKIDIDPKKMINYFFNFSKQSTIKISIPKSYQGDTDIKTISGNIKLDSIKQNKIFLYSTSGNIKFNKIDANTIIKTVSGDIEGKIVRGSSEIKSTSGDIDVTEMMGDVSSSTVSGEIEFKYLNGAVDFNSISGSIEIDKFLITGESNIKTISGEVEIKMDSKSNLVINANSLSGKINYPSGSTNMGIEPYNELTIKTTSGNIKIEKRY